MAKETPEEKSLELLHKKAKLKHETMLVSRVERLARKLAEIDAINYELIFSKNQTRRVVEARAVLSYVLYLSGFGFSEIGRIFNRDHSTIIYYCNGVEERITAKPPDEDLKKRLQFLRLLNANITQQLMDESLRGT